jgi:hypothetical protein
MKHRDVLWRRRASGDVAKDADVDCVLMLARTKKPAGLSAGFFLFGRAEVNQ